MSAGIGGPDGGELQALALLREVAASAGDDRARAAVAYVTKTIAETRKRLADVTARQAFGSRILDAIANGVITVGPEREITTFNRAAEATFGIASERFVGRPATALGELIGEVPELLETYFANGAGALRAEVDGRRSDGTPLVLAVQLAPLADPGDPGIAMAIVDLTKQRALEAAHEADVEKVRRVQETFSRYLAPHVVESLMHDPGSIVLGGERRRATMLFADVCGFTRLAARLSPERVVEIVNAYFEAAVHVIFEHDGLLDKFYGDGLMAVFGPPANRADDAARAVRAALRLHDAVRGLGPEIDYPLRISVGLATGEVVAGHFGSVKRMDYTVIGDAVNLANGLQAIAPPGTVYCDEETVARAGPLPIACERFSARLKGRDDPIPAFALLPP